MSAYPFYSEIKFYNVPINKYKNFKVDDWADYLETLTPFVYTDNFVKHDLEITLKLPLKQDVLYPNWENMTGTLPYNYCSITNKKVLEEGEETDVVEKPVYYFIDDITFNTQTTCFMKLTQDTLNSLVEGDDYAFGEKTHVSREHKNRYEVSARYFTQKLTYHLPATSTYIDDNNVTHYVFVEQYNLDSRAVIEERNNFDYEIIESSDTNVFIDHYTVNTRTNITLWIDTIINADGYLTIEYSSQYSKRIINLKSEGITPPQYKKETYTGRQDIDTNWYLLYINTNDIEPTDFNQVNPINCYIFADRKLPLRVFSDTKTIQRTSFTQDYTYALTTYHNLSAERTYKINGDNYRVYKHRQMNSNREWVDIYFYLAFENDGVNLLYGYYSEQYIDGQFQKHTLIESGTCSYIEIEDSPVNLQMYYIAADVTPILWHFSLTQMFVLGGTYTDVQSNSLDSLDRTNSKIVKLIKLPYAPIKFEYDPDDEVLTPVDNTIQYDSGTGFLQVTDINIKFESDFRYKSYGDNDVNPFEILVDSTMLCDLVDNPYNARFTNDSKLYHSDFYTLKNVYDSFNYIMQLEKISEYYNPLTDENLLIRFKQTNTLNSKMMFIFENWIMDYSQADYDKYMIIQRNNELTLYSSQYLNYLRTGYNYDIKARDRSLIATYGQMASSVSGTILGTMATGGLGAVVGGVGLVNSFISSINGVIANEDSINAKLTQYQQQAVSVSGADDIDLLDEYSENRLKLNIYSVTDEVKGLLNNMFYYCGYSTNEMKKPLHNNRHFFDFLQAQIDFENINVPAKYIEDLSNKFSQGVTYIHKYEDADGNDAWDLTQEKENYEVLFQPYIDEYQ